MNLLGLDGRRLLVAGAAVVALAVASTVALAAADGAFRTAGSAPNGQCAAPALPGSVVDVTLTDMGMMMPSMMGSTFAGLHVSVSAGSVAAGTVSVRAVNTGSLVHELLVLPLDDNRHTGERAVGPDGRVDESRSLGEASRTCGGGDGDGIAPGGIGWVTVNLSRGRYELICNMPGHYAGGMHAELTVD